MRGAFRALDEDKLVPYIVPQPSRPIGATIATSPGRTCWQTSPPRPVSSASASSPAIETDACKPKLRANTDELIARGGFGSPTMFVGSDDVLRQRSPAAVKAALEAA